MMLHLLPAIAPPPRRDTPNRTPPCCHVGEEVCVDRSEPDPADNLAHTTYTSTFPNPVVAEIVNDG